MTNKLLFIAGLVVFLIGQIILAQGNAYVYSLKPIDFAHWSLLVGVVLLIPQVVTFPRKRFSYIGIPLALIGIVCNIGMCVLDFIWWSFPDEASRIEFTNHISQVPSIWKPFISIGSSSKIFNLGLLLISLDYIKSKKWGVLLIAVGTLILMHLIPIPYRLLSGYTLTLIGYSLVLLKPNNIKTTS